MKLLVLRLAFGVAAIGALYGAIWAMTRWSWRIDGALAIVAVVAFAYVFEREEP